MAPDEVATLISEVKSICARLNRIEPKIDQALLDKADWEALKDLSKEVSTKADKIELEKLHTRLPLWVTAVFSIGSGIIGSLITIIVVLLKHW